MSRYLVCCKKRFDQSSAQIYRLTWYIDDEVVVFALADGGFDVDVKARLPVRLLAVAQPTNLRPGNSQRLIPNPKIKNFFKQKQFIR